MNPAVALCPHLRADDLAHLSIDPAGMLEWWDGPVTAVARCDRCDGRGVLELLDWSRSHRVRIFALAAIEPAAVALFLRNRERGSCDLARADREVEALFASAGAVERVIAVDVEPETFMAPPLTDLTWAMLASMPWAKTLIVFAPASLSDPSTTRTFPSRAASVRPLDSAVG